MFTLDDSGSMEFDYLTPDAEEPSGWQKRSSSFNKLYYNPEVTYRPWIKADGSDYPISTEYPNGKTNQIIESLVLTSLIDGVKNTTSIAITMMNQAI